MKKRNLYIGLTIICILSVIFLESLSSKALPSLEKPILSSSDKISKNLPSQNPIFIFISFFYTFLFFAGLINLGISFIRKIKGYPISHLNPPKKKLPLTQESTAELIFLISLLILLTFFLPNFFLLFNNLKLIYIILVTNLILQLGTIFIIFSYIKPNFFGLGLRKKELNFVFKIYTAAEFNKGFTEIGEAVGNADGIVGYHGADSLEGLDFLIANANIAESQAPRLYDPRQAKGSLLRI
ncbi:MAG: hypothetical protein R6U54_00360 [Candidatus Omnitrophota bacterium]